MESRIVLFPEDTSAVEVCRPDELCDEWVLTLGDPGSRVQIHASYEFFARLHAAIGEQL